LPPRSHKPGTAGFIVYQCIFTVVVVVVVVAAAAAATAVNNLFSESEQRTVLVKTVTRTGTPPGKVMII